MKIIYFGHYWRSFGGTEFDIRTMLTALSKVGYECCAVVYDAYGSPVQAKQNIEQEGVKVYYYDNKTIHGNHKTKVNIYRMNVLKSLRDIIEQGDIVLTIFSPEKEAWKVAKSKGAYVIQKYTVVYGDWKEDDWSDVDYHVFNSYCCMGGMKNIANINGPRKVIYPEIDIESDFDSYDGEGSIGMVNPVRHKGSQIFSHLANVFTDESFIAAGGWAIKKSGHYNKDDRWEYLSHTDDFSKFYKLLKLLVVPTQDTHCETFGRVVIEAMKYGVPVIASKKDGLIEASNGSILLVEDYSNALAWESIVRKMLDENVLMMWHELAKKRAIEYTIDFSIKEWRETFEFLCS